MRAAPVGHEPPAAAAAGRWVCGRPDSPASGGDVPPGRDEHLSLVTALAGRFPETFQEFPPHRQAASLIVGQVGETGGTAITSHR